MQAWVIKIVIVINCNLINYIGEKDCTFNYILLILSSILFISGYQQNFSKLILKGSGDYDYIFAPCFNYKLKLKNKISPNQFQRKSKHMHVHVHVCDQSKHCLDGPYCSLSE